MEKTVERIMAMMDECHVLAQKLHGMKRSDQLLIKQAIHAIYHESVIIKEILLLSSCPLEKEML